MIKLQVNEYSKRLATRYWDAMKEAGICMKAKASIGELIKKYRQDGENVVSPEGKEAVASIIEYLNLLLSKYDTLQTAPPNSFQNIIDEFESHIKGDELKNCSKSINNSASLATQIVEAMNYKDIRKTIYPRFMREMHIKACVYCNANYTITDFRSNAYCELDHWNPKSYYPYLSTSFFNLQPSCSSCNKRKGEDKKNPYFHLWKDQDDNQGIEVFRFQLEPESIVKYLINHDISELSISISGASPEYDGIVKHANKRLNLKSIYKEHMDVAEEIVWRRQIYNDSFIYTNGSLLRRIGYNNKFIHNSVRDNFILGISRNPEDVHKHPLSKMAQDIGKQLGIL